MKTARNLFLFTLGVLTASASFAYTEQFDDGFDNPLQPNGQKYAAERLDEAVKQRHYYYLKNKIRNGQYKNRKQQLYRHLISRAKKNAPQRSTQAKRTGALQDVPDYAHRRHSSSLVTDVPNNPKRNFRVRAYDYYVEGGEAGEEALTEDVINMATHRVPRIGHNKASSLSSVADVLAAIRNQQRKIGTSGRVPAGHQATTFRRGDSSRNFLHPYMNFDQ